MTEFFKGNYLRRWERINDFTQRLKTFGGWIVEVSNGDGSHQSICFVPDPDHDWELPAK